MARLTKRNGDGDGDLIACFGCDKVQEDTCECGNCEHFQAAIEKLTCFEEAMERRQQLKEEEYD